MDHYTTAEADRIPYTQKSAYAIGMLVNNLQAAALWPSPFKLIQSS